jgi:SAM-dependent methyltransferase
MPDSDPRLDYPATNRNREVILAVLREVLRDHDRVLEIGSGSGQHAEYFARHWPTLHWQPSEVETTTFASIEAWSKDLGNVASPRVIDVIDPIDRWLLEGLAFDAVFSANVIHIAPWRVCLGLLAGAAALLEPGRPLVLYGPFMRAGRHTAPSNEAFDRGLRARNAEWGVRDLDVVTREAARHGLQLDRVVEMPANNLTVVYRRSERHE